MRSIVLLLFVVLLSNLAFGQTKPELTVKMIMQDQKEWIGTSPSGPNWSEDGATLYFDWNPDVNPGDSLYKVPATGGTPVKVSPAERRGLPSNRGEYTADYSRKVYTKNGDIYIYDVKSKRAIQLTNTVGNEASPYFSKDEKQVLFTTDNNLFELDLQSGRITQLTNFIAGKERRDRKKSEQDEWLSKDELAMMEVLRKRKENSELRRAANERDNPWRPKEFYLDGRRVSNMQLSPNKDYITFTLFKSAENSVNTEVPNYVTESSYTEMIRARSNVGGPQGENSAFIYNINKDTIYEVKTEGLSDLDMQPEFKQDYPQREKDKKKKRGVLALAPEWSKDGRYAFMVFRSEDNKDRWIALVDPATAKVEELDHQHDDAWIAGPGIGWSFGGGSTGWMPDNKSVWFQSEESGYSHLYKVDVTTKKRTALTSGKYEVDNPRISRDKKYWYFEANMEHPGDRQIYYMPINGGKAVKITTMTGGNDAFFSPDESRIALLYSSSNHPAELYIMDNPVKGKKAGMKKITSSTTKEFDAYPWRKPDVVTFKASDDAEVYARIYVPEQGVKNGAAVIFVHGAGYLQNAHKWWSSYSREYMFHNLLADKGYTVLDIDYRASAGYGRDWRTGIYRHMGGKDLSDQVDGAKFLVDQHNIDAKRIGIYGGSYGGFITLMAMFTKPDVFAAGAALRSVTDWAHYNHGYTSNILNTPVEDSLAYRKSSPIYYAEGLKGHLLMCHGMVDTNVHFQDIVRLTQRLIELGKEDWELAVYPVENHGFQEPSSWTDEYSRILKLFEEQLK